MLEISQIIANELKVKNEQVLATIKLLDDGSTVPFIARYRKEVTGGLSDTDLRTLEERLNYLRELEERRATILASIKEQGKLTKELEKYINDADTKARLEDLYKPYKPKRITKGQIAIEAGLEPLADSLLKNPTLIPETEAEKFINKEKSVNDVKAALDGAKYILMERFAEDANLVGKFRDLIWNEGIIESKVSKDKEKEGIKYKDYFDFKETIKTVPSHRALAILRGRKESFLDVSINLDTDCISMVAEYFGIKDKGRAADKWLMDVCKWTWQIKLKVSLDIEVISKLREAAEAEAIKVFSKNLEDLLMAPPAGHKNTIGLDPGFRTGVKLAVVDSTGKLLEYKTIYPHAPQNQWQEALAILAAMSEKYRVSLIGIGNGTASRETESLVNDLIKKFPKLGITKMVVSEAGASVYSASEFAAKEFPDIDVSIRGAISIARRLQDPLAELVKIEPKAIGVGQYQHDVSQLKLSKSLDAVVEDCVNKVGVDLNTASAPLLTRVSGLNTILATNVVKFREKIGKFSNREQLKEVTRLGDKAFEQCAGFLRISNGENPLDSSGVHPESYPIVNKILQSSNKEISNVIGDISFLKKLKPKDYIDDSFGEPTVRDIISELEKPGRDPRAQFKTVRYKEGVNTISDLKEDMILEGVITNVANFGAFVDIGVHQDGLVHISELSDTFVKDPREVVKVGDIVSVKVTEVEVPRKRISLTLKLDSKAASANKTSIYSPNNRKSNNDRARSSFKPNNRSKSSSKQNLGSIFGDALRDAIKK